MAKVLIIGFSSSEKIRKCFASWTGGHLKQIDEFTPLDELQNLKIEKGIAYVTGNANSSIPAIEIRIINVLFKKSYLTVFYELGNELSITSGSVRRSLRNSLISVHGNIINLPFCAAVDETYLNSAVDDETLSEKLKKFKKKNDWQGIATLYEPLEETENKPHIWDNSYLLEHIAFACAKLSEVYVNVKRLYPDEKEKKSFLKTKKRYRELTIKFRKRLIELNQEKPGCYSNLGYSYYQFCNELLTPGGRRDGNLREDAECALDNLEKALMLDPNRITDLYRKGRVLTKILPPVILFGGGKKPDSDNIKKVRSLIKKGISSYQSAENAYELIPIIDDKSIIRYRKEYIRSLYSIASAFSDLVPSGWDYLNYLEGGKSSLGKYEISVEKINETSVFQFSETQSNFKAEFTSGYIENLDKAILYIEKCITKDKSEKMESRKIPELYEYAACDNCIEGVFKLYSAGKYYLQKYFITEYLLKAGRLPDSVNAIKSDFLITAEKYLRRALSFPWSKEKSKQNKGFIAERLARLLIAKKSYQEAMNLLERFVSGNTDYYIRYTYSLAAIKNGNFEKAKINLEKSVENPKFNKDIKTGYYMLSFVYKSIGNIEKSKEYLNKYNSVA